MRLKGVYVDEPLLVCVMRECVPIFRGHPGSGAKIFLAFNLFADHQVCLHSVRGLMHVLGSLICFLKRQ